MTLTLEIPDELAARMESIPADQRNNYAITALAYGVDNMPLQEEGEPVQEAVAAIQEAVRWDWINR